MKKVLKPLLALSVFAGFLFLMKALPFREWLEPVFATLEDYGVWGWALFALAGMVLTALFVPVTVLITLSGFFFGFGVGYALASVILIGGTSIGFAGGRVLWPHIQDWGMFQQKVFQAVREAVEREGNRLVAFLRMTPFFHFMTGNLFFGSLDMRFGSYMLFSYLGMIPGTALLVYAGSAANRSVTGDAGLSVWRMVFFGVGLLVFAGVSARVTQVTRRILQSSEEEKSTTTAR